MPAHSVSARIRVALGTLQGAHRLATAQRDAELATAILVASASLIRLEQLVAQRDRRRASSGARGAAA